jgi:hypothetical protein
MLFIPRDDLLMDGYTGLRGDQNCNIDEHAVLIELRKADA